MKTTLAELQYLVNSGEASQLTRDFYEMMQEHQQLKSKLARVAAMKRPDIRSDVIAGWDMAYEEVSYILFDAQRHIPLRDEFEAQK